MAEREREMHLKTEVEDTCKRCRVKKESKEQQKT